MPTHNLTLTFHPALAASPGTTMSTETDNDGCLTSFECGPLGQLTSCWEGFLLHLLMTRKGREGGEKQGKEGPVERLEAVRRGEEAQIDERREDQSPSGEILRQ